MPRTSIVSLLLVALFPLLLLDSQSNFYSVFFGFWIRLVTDPTQKKVCHHGGIEVRQDRSIGREALAPGRGHGLSLLGLRDPPEVVLQAVR